MARQDFSHYLHSDEALEKSLVYISQRFPEHTVFFSIPAEDELHIRRSINRGVFSIEEGENTLYKDFLTRLVLGRAPRLMTIPSLAKDPQTEKLPITLRIGDGSFLGLSLRIESNPSLGIIGILGNAEWVFSEDDRNFLTMTGFLIEHIIQAEHEKLRDRVTGLYHPMFLQRVFNDWPQPRSSMAVLCIDFHQSKEISGVYSNEMKDVFLQKSSALLLDYFPNDSIISKSSKDIFMILLPLKGKDSLFKYMESFVNHLFLYLENHPVTLPHEKVYVTASVGISFYPEDGEEIEELLEKAEHAKNKKRDPRGNQLNYYTKPKKKIDRFHLQNELRQTFIKDQLYMVYQPQFHLQSGSFIGVEALLRWESPKLGSVLPADFIPVLEKIGLISEIGEWIIEQSCLQMAALQQTYPFISLSVNIVRAGDKIPNIAGIKFPT